MPFLAASIKPPNCQSPFPGGSSTLYTGVFCNSPTSAQYNGYSDPGCTVLAQSRVGTFSQTDGNNQPLASWSCTRGSDGIYYSSTCVVASALPAELDPATSSNFFIQSSSAATACPLNAPVEYLLSSPVGACGALTKSTTGPGFVYGKLSCDGASFTATQYSDSACSMAISGSAFSGPLGCTQESYSPTTYICNGVGANVVVPRSGSATPSATPSQTPSRTQASASTPPTYSTSPSSPPKYTLAPRVCGSAESVDRAVLLLPQGAPASNLGCTVTGSYSDTTTRAVPLEAGGLCRHALAVCTRPADFCGPTTLCWGACPTSCVQSPGSGGPPGFWGNAGAPVGPTYWGCPPGVPLGSVYSISATVSAAEVAGYSAKFATGGVPPGWLGFDYSQLGLTVVLCNPATASCNSALDSKGAAAPGSDVAAVGYCPAGSYSAPSPSPLATTTNTATYTVTALAGASPTGTPRPTPAASATPSSTPLFASTMRTCAFLQDWQRALVPVPQPQTSGVSNGCWVTNIDSLTGQESRTQAYREPGALCLAVAGICTGATPGSNAWCVGTCQVGGAASGAFYWGCPTNVPSGSMWVKYSIAPAAQVSAYAEAYRTGGTPGITLAPGTVGANVVVAACNGAYASACDPNLYASTPSLVLQCPWGQPIVWQALGNGGAAPAALSITPGGIAGLVIGLLLLLAALGLCCVFRGLMAAYWKRRLTGGKDVAGAAVVISSPLAMAPPPPQQIIHIHMHAPMQEVQAPMPVHQMPMQQMQVQVQAPVFPFKPLLSLSPRAFLPMNMRHACSLEGAHLAAAVCAALAALLAIGGAAGPRAVAEVSNVAYGGRTISCTIWNTGLECNTVGFKAYGGTCTTTSSAPLACDTLSRAQGTGAAINFFFAMAVLTSATVAVSHLLASKRYPSSFTPPAAMSCLLRPLVALPLSFLALLALIIGVSTGGSLTVQVIVYVLATGNSYVNSVAGGGSVAGGLAIPLALIAHVLTVATLYLGWCQRGAQQMQQMSAVYGGQPMQQTVYGDAPAESAAPMSAPSAYGAPMHAPVGYGAPMHAPSGHVPGTVV